MSDPFAKVAPGQRLQSLPAAAWNAFIDAAQANRNRLGNRTGQTVPAYNDGQIIQVKNDTALDLVRFSVLGLTTPIFPPDDEAPGTLHEIAFVGVKPVAADHAGGRVAILLAPLAAGAIGPAQIDGACLCRIKGDGDPTSIRMADVKDDQAGYLIPSGGGVQVIWIADAVEPEEEEEAPLRWAIVRLGGGGGDASALYQIQAIENDYLVCKTWDGETLGFDEVKIAKPWMLQHNVERYAHLSTLTTVDAQTVDVETASAVEATWKITPAYAADDLIQAVARFTGVTETVESEEVPMELMDMNHDARAWAEVITGG